MTITTTAGGPVGPTTSTLQPLSAREIRFTGGYWGEWQNRNADTILEHCERWIERIGWLSNFDRAASDETGWEHVGVEFVDSEVYKLLEGMAWELGRRPDEDLRARFDSLVLRVAAAQESDGYLNTFFGRSWQRPRWSDLEWGHELYCAGHLIQAAVAVLRTVGAGLLVDVARRVAELLWVEFGPNGRDAVCGHPEIEPALVEFGRALSDSRWITLAALFVDRRGRGLLKPIEYGQEYFQDDIPVRDADVMRGHSVRAAYLAAGALDVATETGDDDLAEAVERQWSNTVTRRTYITGGMGSHHQDEAFGADFELPPDRAYSETCAGIGSNMLSWRLLLHSGDVRYADLMERTLLNVVLASPRADGRAFFYTNTLHQRVPGSVPQEDEVNARALASLRAPWFEVSCCPTNVARTLASAELYFATKDDNGIQLHQYGDYEIDTRLPDGTTVAFNVASGWPTDGTVTVTSQLATNDAVTVSLRVPAWAKSAVLAINGESDRPVEPGVVRVRRRFDAGDTITLTVPMQARWTKPHPLIDAVRGTVAVERGPLVLALELLESSNFDVNHVEIDTNAALITTVDGAEVSVRVLGDAPSTWPYPAEAADVADTQSVPLKPYSTWANRGPSTMRIWLPIAP